MIKRRERDSLLMKDLMKIFIKETRLEKGLKKIHVAEAWEKLMGKGVVSYTREVRLQNGTLIVALNSSVLREELTYGKDKIIKMMNEEIGEDIIKKLLLV